MTVVVARRSSRAFHVPRLAYTFVPIKGIKAIKVIKVVKNTGLYQGTPDQRIGPRRRAAGPLEGACSAYRGFGAQGGAGRSGA